MWLIKFTIFAIVFTCTYFDTFLSLVKTWSNSTADSHGFIVPFISLYFAWLQKDKLKEQPLQPDKILGGVIISLAGFMLILSKLNGILLIQQLSIVVILPGLVLMFLGRIHLKKLLLPLGYLILMVPIIGTFDQIHWPFQLFTSYISSILLNGLGIPVLRNAQFISMPNATLEVAPECSGLSYLTSIIAIGCPIAYFTFQDIKKRIIFGAIGILIAVLANGIRVTLIGTWSYYIGGDIHGPLHIFEGFFVSIIGYVFLFFTAWCLSRASPPCSENYLVTKRDKTPWNITFDTKELNKSWIIAITIITIVFSYCYLRDIKPLPLNNSLETLPFTIGNWKSENDIAYNVKTPFDVRGADSEFIRIYRNPTGRKITLYIAYYNSQGPGKKVIQYSLRHLHRNSMEYVIKIPNSGDLKLLKAVYSGDSRFFEVLFWYRLNGKVFTNRYKAALFTTVEGLVHRHTNGAIVMIFCEVAKDDGGEKLLEDEIDFAREVAPLLSNYIP